MDDTAAIPCVIYAAKSTEDKRGSIPEQLRECQVAVDADPRRRFIAEYKDEKFSAYRRDRGPGLRDATQHAEDLAAEHGVAELWAQHSDRIARGDGRAARHTVEIALWALKHDVRVRTLQDPDTFRDLLYAVVTGQRNNEDSKRKGLSTQAGRKRAAQRGEYIGHLPDGYRLHSWVDERAQLHKQMVIDEQRKSLIELVLRLALRRRSCGQIAAGVNKAGWLTKPVKSGSSPRPFGPERIRDILRNPRYAGLSVYHGEVMARGCWPAYISERQHERIVALLGERLRGDRLKRRQQETYLLARVATCARCGASMHVHSGRRRADGSRPRSYLCSSHTKARGRHQCDAPPIEAHSIEAMFVASVDALLLTDAPEAPSPAPRTQPSQKAGHEQLRAAVLAGDERRLQGAIEGELRRLQPHTALIREAVISQRQARELAEVECLRSWAEQERLGRTSASRQQCVELNALLRGWFAEISIDVRAKAVLLSATRRQGAGEPKAPRQIRVDRAAWTRASARASSQALRYVTWEKAEIVGALQGWADVKGRSPTQSEWQLTAAGRPSAQTVVRRLGRWDQALRKAGLQPAAKGRRHEPWPRTETIASLQAWTRQHRRAPAASEWMRATPERPCASSVRKQFGRWDLALVGAGLEPPPRKRQPPKLRSREQIIEALRAWTVNNGRPPVGPDWVRATPERPCTATVYKQFGSWRAALEAAGL
jgi:DNA invertase Pin-like site-specific DNA recombinase